RVAPRRAEQRRSTGPALRAPRTLVHVDRRRGGPAAAHGGPQILRVDLDARVMMEEEGARHRCPGSMASGLQLAAYQRGSGWASIPNYSDSWKYIAPVARSRRKPGVRPRTAT